MIAAEASSARLGLMADVVLVVHFALVAFVVVGLLAVWVGNGLGLRGLDRVVNAFGFRAAHALAIAVVVAEAWLGIACPLTTLERALRARAGGAGPDPGEGFIAGWLSRLLYYDAPAWAFTLAYSLFGLLVLASWWRYPPRRGGGDLPSRGRRGENGRDRG